MKLTRKLLGYLNRVFDKGAASFLALRVNFVGGLTWAVVDEVLTLTPAPSMGDPLAIDLSQYTLSTLSEFIAAQSGYSVVYLSPDRSGLSARVLLDACGDQSQSNGDHLYGYTSLLWAWLESVSRELKTAADQIALIPAEMSVPTADGDWLDVLGGQFGVLRDAAEPDTAYGPRIIATILLPRGNNNAIANALTAYTGEAADVVDVVSLAASTEVYDGSFNHDSSHTYSAAGAAAQYGLFDVGYAFDLLNGTGLSAFHDQVAALVETLRDAGTHMRSLALNGSTLTDTYATPPTDAASGMAAVLALADSPTAPPTDTSALLADVLGMLDTITDPGDATDELIVAADYIYDGHRHHDGIIFYGGGLLVLESIDGLTTYGEEPLDDLGVLATEGGDTVVTEGGTSILIT